MIRDIASKWSMFKVSLGYQLGVDADLLHVYVGMILFLSFILLSKKKWGLVVPWCMVFSVECFNEALDMSRPPGSIENDLGSSLHDAFSTMFLPTILLLLWPRLVVAAAPKERVTSARRRTVPAGALRSRGESPPDLVRAAGTPIDRVRG